MAFVWNNIIYIDITPFITFILIHTITLYTEKNCEAFYIIIIISHTHINTNKRFLDHNNHPKTSLNERKNIKKNNSLNS